MVDLKLYIVRNSEGKYFRSKGYGGYGETWVDDINKAKIYGKIGQARSRVSWFYNNYPEYGVAEILELSNFTATTIKEEDRVLKQKRKKETAKLNRNKLAAQRKVELAQQQLKEAEKIINEYKR